ncbi:hypothetical protein H0H93_000385 [Arthromyces matolae]|nr:hypothetical protein H0H93_000385 [Arthromyces matolae]
MAGLFEINTIYVPSSSKLIGTTVSVYIPGYGPAVGYKSGGTAIDLLNPKDLDFSIPNASLDGTVKFSYNSDQTAVQFDWDVFMPWLGTERAKLFTYHELAALKNAPLRQAIIGKRGKPIIPSEKTVTLAASFIHNNVAAGTTIVSVPGNFSVKSEGYDIGSISFLIFELEGRVVPTKLAITATLYAKIPFIGRVKLVAISGSLLEGVDASFDLAVAKGELTLSVKAVNGTHEVYVEGNAKVKYVKAITLDPTKLFTVPF